MKLANLFNINYWFSQPEAAGGFTLWFLLGIMLAFVVGGIAARIIAVRVQEKTSAVIAHRLGSLGLTVGLLGLVWLFFRQEHIFFLGWRFWLLPLIMFVIWWKYSIIRYWIKRVPEIKAKQHAREQMEKYLPKRS